MLMLHSSLWSNVCKEIQLMFKISLTILGIILWLMLPSGSRVKAAEVDYSGLEEIFGEPVTMSATGKPQRVSEAPVSMHIITAEEIKRSGALDIPQILRRVAGVEVSRSFKGHADVNIRGFNQPFSNRILTLINGRQIYIDNFGMTLWHSLPIQLSEIKQIEVVRGPNTSLFGFYAASGVINIITYNPIFDDVSTVEGRIGSHNHQEGHGVMTVKPNKQSGIRVSLGGLASDGFSRDTMPFQSDADDAIKRKNFNIDGVYRLSEVSSLRIEAGVAHQTSDNSIPYYVNIESDSDMSHFRASYSHESDYGVWNANLYRNEVNMTLDNRNFFGQTISPESENILNVIQLSNLFSLSSSHNIRIGAEYRNNSMQGDEVGTDEAKFSMDVMSATAMWDWKIKKNISFTNSIRIDSWKTEREGGVNHDLDTVPIDISLSDYDRDEVEYSFNSGILYKPYHDSTYRFSVARGLHIPSLVELARSRNTLGADTYGNPNLDTETNLTVEAGYSHNLTPHNITLGSNIYYQRLENLIVGTVYELGGSGGEQADFTFENVGDANSYGIELMAEGTLLNKQLRWGVNYNYIIIQDKPDGLPEHYMDFESTQPKHKVNVLLGYDYNNWEFDTDLHYVSRLSNFRATVGDALDSRRVSSVDAYLQMNARIGYNISKNTSISLDGFNLLDEHHERPAYPLIIGIAGGNEIGRAALLTVKHRF